LRRAERDYNHFGLLVPGFFSPTAGTTALPDLKAGNWVRFAKFWPNATLAHRIYFERLPRFASLTPAPPPFSGMNSTPARSKAARTSRKVRA
jgi:hypothetical protein